MIDNNLLKMEIFYKEFNFENIVETPGYSVGIMFTYVPLFVYYCGEYMDQFVPSTKRKI